MNGGRWYLRYVWIAIRSEEFTAFPEAIEWCYDGTWYHNLQNLLDKVLIKAWYCWRLTQVFQRPCRFAHKHFHRHGFLHNLQVIQQRLAMQHCLCIIGFGRLYEQLIVSWCVNVTQGLLRVGEFRFQLAAHFQPQLINIRMDYDTLESNTKCTKHQQCDEDDDSSMLVYGAAQLKEMWLEEMTQIDWRTAAVCFTLENIKTLKHKKIINNHERGSWTKEPEVLAIYVTWSPINSSI